MAATNNNARGHFTNNVIAESYLASQHCLESCAPLRDSAL